MDAQHLPQSRSQAGDRHLKFYETRDNLLGGPDAAVHHLGGTNTVADKGRRIVYLPHHEGMISALPSGDEVLVVGMDKAACAAWVDGYTSFTQTYADLFASPGWQAAEFRRALWDSRFREPDWSQEVQPRASVPG